MVSWKEIRRVGIGSLNPVKKQAVEIVFQYLNRNDCEFYCLDAPSNVRDQPIGNQETIEGAMNRAKYCLQNIPDLDIAFGIEGSVDILDIPELGKQGFIFGWTAAIDKTGEIGLGSGNYGHFPDYITQRLLTGELLGNIVDEIYARQHINHQEGFIGNYTKGFLNRSQAHAIQVVLALGKWINPKLFN